MTHQAALSWVHFGDLHMTRAGESNHRDFAQLVEAANRGLAGAVDFALLPGDNADDGVADQFALVAAIASRLEMPLHILPGDHDFKQHSLQDFYERLAADELPYAAVVKGYCCLFLDVVSKGGGGPDFRLDADQLQWLENQLSDARTAGQAAAIFMHTYPADLSEGSEGFMELLGRYSVLMIDMGHTHYNELSNDGRTIFATTRSTGQVEEDAVGFSTVVIDEGVISWRFKPLAALWPWVQITTPADHRLLIDPDSNQQILRQSFVIRAKVWGDVPVTKVSYRLGESRTGSMVPVAGERAMWRSSILGTDDLPEGIVSLEVQACDARGSLSHDTVQVRLDRVGHWTVPDRIADGSDRNRVGVWREKCILGTQLGPNRNGKKW